MTWRGWQVVVACLAAAIVSATTAMAYANRVAHDSERKWCGLVVTLDDTYRETPPETDIGRRVAEDIKRLRREFGCP